MRLTKEIKNKIVDAAVHDTMAPLLNAHKKSGGILGLMVYNRYYDAYVQDMKRLPAEFFVYRDSIRVYVPAPTETRPDNVRSFIINLSESKPFAAVHEPSYSLPELREIGSPALIEKLKAWDRRGDELLTRHRGLRSEIRALVDGCSTLKKLEEAWPEGRIWFPSEGAIENAPAVTARGVVDMIAKIKAEGEACETDTV